MSGPSPAVAACRVAVREALAAVPAGSLVLVACSGGADSLALAEATAFEARRAGQGAGAVVVDHGIQDGSAEVATAAADQCRSLGLEPVEVVRVVVPPSRSGPEAAAREARYAALQDAARRLGAVMVLLGHTRDDQAEQVLLGLARGSGARSLAGMPRTRGVFARPLLGVTRSQTEQACEAKGLRPWDDPHNADPAYLRVRARAVLAELERELGPGVAAALARSADQLREDADCLDALAAQAASGLDPTALDAGALAALPRAVRMRVWRRTAIAAGAAAGQLSSAHLRACDSLLTDWRGQGPVHLPGPVLVARSGGWVSMTAAARVE